MEVRKSILEELTFAKNFDKVNILAKSDFLDFIKFNFMNLTNFVVVHRFSIFLPSTPRSISPSTPDKSRFSHLC